MPGPKKLSMMLGAAGASPYPMMPAPMQGQRGAPGMGQQPMMPPDGRQDGVLEALLAMQPDGAGGLARLLGGRR